MNDEKRLGKRFFYLIFLLCPTLIALLLGEYDFFVIGAFNFFGLLPAFLTAKFSFYCQDKLKSLSKITWVLCSSLFGMVITFFEILFFQVVSGKNFSGIIFALPLIGAAAAFFALSLVMLLEWRMNRQK